MARRKEIIQWRHDLDQHWPRLILGRNGDDRRTLPAADGHPGETHAYHTFEVQYSSLTSTEIRIGRAIRRRTDRGRTVQTGVEASTSIGLRPQHLPSFGRQRKMGPL